MTISSAMSSTRNSILIRRKKLQERRRQPKEATEKNKEDGQFTKQKTKKIEGNGNMKEENQKKCGVRNLRNKQM